jgi:hypothetical protein
MFLSTIHKSDPNLVIISIMILELCPKINWKMVNLWFLCLNFLSRNIQGTLADDWLRSWLTLSGGGITRTIMDTIISYLLGFWPIKFALICLTICVYHNFQHNFFLAISRLSDLFWDEYKLICEMGIIMGIYLQTLTLRVGIRV